jgi:hypothetical protein
MGFGLATAKAERVVAGGRAIEVARVRFTEAGRAALVDRRRCPAEDLGERKLPMGEIFDGAKS